MCKGLAVVLCWLALANAGCSTWTDKAALTPKTSTEQRPGTHYSATEIGQLTEQDNLKSKYTGTLNGVTFKSIVTADDLGCDTSSRTPMTDSTSAEIAVSPLNFQAAYLPPGGSLYAEAASSCQGRVASLARMYRGVEWEVTIARFSGKADSATAPIDRMKNMTVGDKPAVLVTELPRIGSPKNSDAADRRLVIVEDFGITVVIAGGLGIGEIVKVAEGVEPNTSP